MEEEDLDPRIQTELENLNSYTEEINTLENELDEARTNFRHLSSEYSQKLNDMFRKNRKSITKSRPYFEAKAFAKETLQVSQTAARNFQHALSFYYAAKETFDIADRRMNEDLEKRRMDTAWQEMLNHATIKLSESERLKTQSDEEHKIASSRYEVTRNKAQQLENKFRRSIEKSRPYFELKKDLEVKLLQQKQNVEDLQKAVQVIKKNYAGTLKNLEKISDEIHENRKLELLLEERESGVGAEENNGKNITFEESTFFPSGFNEFQETIEVNRISRETLVLSLEETNESEDETESEEEERT